MKVPSVNKRSFLFAMLQHIQRWGLFDRGLAAYALRTTLASCVALACGWWLGLDHPQWAAMSVWAASSQPYQKKGMLLEKSLFRLLGTLIGTLVGVSILTLSHGDILYVTLGLTVWLTLCTGAGNLIHGLLSYLTLLSGYTASLVVLLDIAQGTSIYELGLDRMLTVSTGVIIAMLVGLVFNKVSNEGQLSQRIKLLTHSVLTLLTQASYSQITQQQIATLVKEAAAIDELLIPHGAGSLRSRRSIHSIRAIIYSNVSLLTRLNTNATMEQLMPLKLSLRRLAKVIKNDLGIDNELQCIEDICKELPEGGLNVAFTDLHIALTERLRYKEQGKVERAKLLHMVVLHRDWVAAKQAMVRTFSVLGAIGLLWNYTNSTIGAFVMLGTSVMVTLFSTFEAPASMMSRVFTWQIVGLAASLLIKGYFWANAGSEGECIVIMILFILPVIIPLSSSRFCVAAMDYVMMYLLLSPIEYPVNFQLSTELPFGLAAVGGTLVAFLGFLLIFPTNRGKRSSRIKAAILSDLQRTYTIEWDSQKMAFIHCRAQHRLLKLINTEPKLSTHQLMGTLQIVSTIGLVGKIRRGLAMGLFSPTEKAKVIKTLSELLQPILHSEDKDNLFEQLLNMEQQCSNDLMQLLAGINMASPQQVAI
ncbi:MAG: FUSC family protein [Psychromonas sp.]